MKIIFAGNMIVDVINEISKYPEKGRLANIKKVSYSVGGSVSNTGIDIKRLDSKLDVQVIGRVGNDDYGKILKDKYVNEGLDITHMIIDEEKKTSFTQVMSEENGERTFFYHEGANDNLRFDDFKDITTEASIFHLGYALLLPGLETEDMEYGNELAKTLAHFEAQGVKTSLDLVSQEKQRFKRVVTPCLKHLNYLIINELEAQALADTVVYKEDETLDVEALKETVIKLIDYGVKDKVIVHSPKLGIICDKTHKVEIINSFVAPKDYIKGTTGAGDAFCAGALYAIMQNQTNEDILKLASAVALMNLGCSDATSGAKSLEETISFTSKLERIKK